MILWQKLRRLSHADMAGGWERIQWFDLMFAEAALLVNAFASCQSRGPELECDLAFYYHTSIHC